MRYDPREQDIAVKRGDNRGQTLVHRNIVRELVRLHHGDVHVEVELGAGPAARRTVELLDIQPDDHVLEMRGFGTVAQSALTADRAIEMTAKGRAAFAPLDERSGEQVAAPQSPGSGRYPPIEPAPGSYIHQ